MAFIPAHDVTEMLPLRARAPIRSGTPPIDVPRAPPIKVPGPEFVGALITLPASWEAYLTQHVLRDARDYPLLVTFIQCSLWIAFSSVVQLCVLPASGSYLWLLVHIPVTWAVLAERFILAMHYSAHRALFSEQACGCREM